jgi:hypothetical protein
LFIDLFFFHRLLIINLNTPLKRRRKKKFIHALSCSLYSNGATASSIKSDGKPGSLFLVW